MVENLRKELEESESETNDFDGDSDDFPEFPNFPDRTKDIADMDNETIKNSNEFAKEDEELLANSRAKRFAELFDPLGFLRRQRMNVRGSFRVNTGVNRKAIRYPRYGVGYPR